MSKPFPIRPIPNSYQIEFTTLPFNTPPGVLLAGEYAVAQDLVETRRRMERFLEAGVSLFVDLTGVNEYPHPYAATLTAVASERNTGTQYLQMPIRDYSTPTAEQLVEILDRLDEGLSQGK